MPVQMSAEALSFWRELLAPFEPHQLSTIQRGNRELTYINKRAIENRLDSVCGPAGWYPEYEATNRGYKCRLSILVPRNSNDPYGSSEQEWTWITKEDGAGFEEMGAYNKQTQEWEPDVDNDEKSGYTNALRRAAQDAWGIGRSLYGKGIPTFLDPNAPPLPIAGPYAAPAAKSSLPKPLTPGWVDPNPTNIVSLDARPKFDNFKIPRPGKAVFAWLKEMEAVFGVRLFNRFCDAGERLGCGKRFDSWNAEQVNQICLGEIEFIRTLPSYKGQFDHLFPSGPPKLTDDIPPPTASEARRILAAKLEAFVSHQTGRPASPAELKAAFGVIAAECANCEGHVGEVPESLAKLDDVTWITNMIQFVNNQIAQSVAAGDPGTDDIPF